MKTNRLRPKDTYYDYSAKLFNYFNYRLQIMLVFIDNLPGDSTLIELQHFLGNHKMSVDYSVHRHEKNVSHFLLIKTNSFESADDLISELDGKCFNGVKIKARKFTKRNKQSPEWTKEERRFSQLELNFI